MTEIIASLQERGISPLCKIQLNVLSSNGDNCGFKDLYHSVVKPSEPGDLPTFSLAMAKFNYFAAIGCIRVSFCDLVSVGNSKELRKVSILVSLEAWVENIVPGKIFQSSLEFSDNSCF